MKKIILNVFIILSLCFFSLSAQEFVVDEAGILTPSEVSFLEEKCNSISQQYNCGVYLVSVKDFANESWNFNNINIEEFAYDYYMFHSFGKTAEKNGIMLILSMADRDFDIMAYGSFGNYSFTDYGKDKLVGAFAKDFGNNNWKDGFSKYLNKVEYLLKWAEKGKPYDYRSLATRIEVFPKALVISILISLLFALIKTNGKKRGLNNIKAATAAGNYLISENVAFADRKDDFTHTTQSKTRIESNSSSSGGGHSGGTSVHSNGSSHRSGKF